MVQRLVTITNKYYQCRMFDRSLKGRNPLWGVRDLEEVTKLAEANGLTLEATVEMPANNLSVVFRKNEEV